LAQVIEFDNHVFQPDSGQLWRGGQALHLTPRAAALLRVLVEQPGMPVSKQQLFERVWSGTVVSDDALTSCILELRKALGDDPRKPRYIETRHRHGYRFIAGTRAGAMAPATQALPSIAVLPFTDISPGHDQGYYCDGLAIELVNRLSQVPGLRVASRTASFQFREQGADVAAVARQLGARYLLEGSIRKSKELLHVTVQLVDVDSGYHAWSRQYDRAPDDVFAIQSEIIEGVGQVLVGAELSAIDKQRLRPLRTGAAAYEHYLHGLQTLRGMTEAGLRHSANQFGRAVELDASYAPAHAGQAMVFGTLYEWFGSDLANLARATEAGLRAVALAPHLAEARVARGFSLGLYGDYAGAVREFGEAIRLNPQLFEAYYYFGRASFAGGDVALASQLFGQAADVRREDFQSPILRGQALRMLGQEQESAECCREGIRRAERVLALNPADSRALSLGAHALLRDGQAPRAREWAICAVAQDPDDMCALINAALVHVQLGDKGLSLDLLERAFSQGFGRRDWIERDPDYDLLRDDPRFVRLLARLA
jgi:adenylate cyclase